MWVLALAFAAAGESDCTLLYEGEMRELIDAQYKVLLVDELPDVAEHDRLSRQLEARLTCVGFMVGRELWARYLVSVAIREYFRDGDWRRPLTTALRIAPTVELPVREGHPLRQFVPSGPPLPGEPLPPELHLRIDGRDASNFVPLDATHLLQRPDGDGIMTRFVVGPAEIPKEIVARPRLPEAVRQQNRRRAVHTWGTAGTTAVLVGGLSSLAAGLVVHAEFAKLDTDQAELPGLIEQGKPLTTAGTTLTTIGVLGLAAVWTVPW